MLFNIRPEVEPVFTLEEWGDIYIVDDIINRGFSVMFLGYSPKKDALYTFNCSDVMKGYYVEYVVFETSFNQINRSNEYKIEAVELLYEASLNNDLYFLMLDKSGYEMLERMEFEDMEVELLPQRGTYFRYNKEKINSKKIG